MQTKKAILATIMLSSLFVTSSSFGHSRYIMPSHTSLSGEDPEMVTLDLSVTNDIFHADRSYGGKAPNAENNTNRRRNTSEVKLTLTAPDGSILTTPDIIYLGRKSSTYATLDQNGTYKASIVGDSREITRYDKADGTSARTNGYKNDITIPAGATNIRSYRSGSTVETFITRNEMSDNILKPTGVGVELIGGTHPNDFFVGEKIELQFSMYGKPAAQGNEVTITLGGTRHRNERAEIKAVTDSEGRIQFQFPEGGFYFLEMNVEQEVSGQDYDYDSYTYSATFEVWPE